ncbi:MAG TPA: polysaccharide biosynthesis/export family protein [Gemmatimonadales bacterium]
MTPFRPFIALAILALAARSAQAQIPGTELTQVLASRPALESLLTRLNDAAQSRDFSASVRDQAKRQADQVRARLADGDFHVGDRIALVVESESTLTNTYIVSSGRVLILPNVGSIPLQGVLRFDLTDYLTQRLRQYLRDPKVRAQSMIRVEITGAVGKQGFWTVPVDIAVDSVYGIAGGIGTTADLKKMKIERAGETLFEGQALHQVIIEGTTIDALGIQAGDVFSVEALPVKNPNPAQRVQLIQYLLTIPVSLFALGRLLGF